VTPEEIRAQVEALLPGAVDRAVVDRGELTLDLDRSRLVEVATALRDDAGLRFEMLASVSGVDYLDDAARLHAVYHLVSLTHHHRVRLEVAVTVDDPVIPTLVEVFPTAAWHERETYDFFGIRFDGHPNLVRILMPDDWEGHPQRKDYPLGGIPVEFKGATIPPPDERRAWA
jgi:NADH-quinone oxidoreductase subunit C